MVGPWPRPMARPPLARGRCGWEEALECPRRTQGGRQLGRTRKEGRRWRLRTEAGQGGGRPALCLLEAASTSQSLPLVLAHHQGQLPPGPGGLPHWTGGRAERKGDVPQGKQPSPILLWRGLTLG